MKMCSSDSDNAIRPQRILRKRQIFKNLFVHLSRKVYTYIFTIRKVFFLSYFLMIWWWLQGFIACKCFKTGNIVGHFRIQFACGKIRTKRNSVSGHFSRSALILNHSQHKNLVFLISLWFYGFYAIYHKLI